MSGCWIVVNDVRLVSKDDNTYTFNIIFEDEYYKQFSDLNLNETGDFFERTVIFKYINNNLVISNYF